MKIQNRLTYIIVFLILIAALLVSCKKQDRRIHKSTELYFEPGLLQFSPDFENLAFCPAKVFFFEEDRARFKYENVYVLNIKTKKVHKVIKGTDERISWLAWQPFLGRDKLWVTVVGSRWKFWPRYDLQQFGYDDNSQRWQVNQSYSNSEIKTAFYWNPKGTVLVGQLRNFFPGKSILDDVLAASWDQGQTAVYYEGVQCLKIFWINDNSFLTQDIGDKTIYKFVIENQTLLPVKTYKYSDNAFLFGVYGKDPVYRLKEGVYIGDERIYDSKTKIGHGAVQEPYVYFSENSSLVVYDVESNTEYQVNTETKSVFPIGFSSNTGKVYWLSERKKIISWDFKDENRIESVVEIDSISN